MKRILFLVLAFLFCLNTNAQQLDHVLGDILVKLKPEAEIYELARSFQTFQKTSTRLQVLKEVSRPMQAWLLSFDFSRIDENQMLAAFRKHPMVEMAQFNHIIRLRETYPNDPHFPLQWQWLNLGQNDGKFDADIDAELAWDISTGGLTAAGDTIVVCVVEGANRKHPDLLDNLWFNWNEIPGNGVDDDKNGYVDDFNGWNVGNKNDNISAQSHGTAVSGLIGARGNNNSYTSGINWNVKMMHVDFAGITEANALEAYTYPWTMRKLYNETGGAKGAFVVAVNSSWGLDNKPASSVPLWCAFYDSLGVVGIISCGATTNNNVDVDKVGDMPSSCNSEYLIIATATNNRDQRTFSGYGLNSVDVAAPGSNVASLTLNAAPSNSTGTSFATPIVTGLVALLYSAPCPYVGNLARSHPAEAALYIRDAIFKGVDTLAALKQELKYGGRVNAYNSLQIIMQNCGPCPTPLGVSTKEVIDTSAAVSWISSDSVLFSTLRWRLFGDTNWIVRDSVKSPLSLNNLKACSYYEVQVNSVCHDTASIFSPVVSFQTDGCCKAPGNLAITGLKDTIAQLSWNSVLAAKSYNLLFKEGDSTRLIAGLISNQLTLKSLLPCTQYSVQLQTVCDTGKTEFTTPVQFRTFGCGPCIDSVYCSSRAENASQEWIKNVTLHSLNNSSKSDGGYGDYTGDPITLSTYKVYPISLTPGYAAAALNEWFAVWIDFNQDGDFNDLGEEVFSAGPTTKTVSGQVIIPGTAKAGLTRMRVSMRWNQKPLPCTPTFNFGEVEDYCLTIIPGTIPICMAPDSLKSTDQNFTSTKISWLSNSEALFYELRYRKNKDTIWQTKSVPGISTTLSGLESCTDYILQARSSCIGILGEWSPNLVFKTQCYPLCETVPAGLDTTMVSDSSAVLSWKSATEALSYRVNYKIITDTVWKTLETQNLSLELDNLDSCSAYQFSVQALCLGGRMSAVSLPFLFKTACISSIQNPDFYPSPIVLRPNPFTSELWLEYKLKNAGKVVLDLFDARGQIMYSSQQYLNAGSHSLHLKSLENLPVGVYLFRLRSDQGMAVQRLIKQ